VTRREIEYGCAVVLIGLLAGVAGAATTLLLHWVEHLTYHYSVGSLLEGIDDARIWRRVLGPMVGGALAGLGWWLLRRRAEVPKLEPTIKAHKPIPRLVMSIDAGLQVLLVGTGASLGREGAPRQFSAALGDLGTSRWTSNGALTLRDREILLACAAGAGLAAVYSVPVGGALFAARILLGSWHPRVLGTALVTSALAVAVAAPVTHLETPLQWPDASRSYLLVAIAVLVAPLAVGVGLAFTTLMAAARPAIQLKSWVLIPAIAAAGLLVGVCSYWFPELPGNGKSILTVSIDHGMTFGAAAAILLLKPLVTAVFLRAGAVGGMLTPSLATGAALGSVVALGLNSWTGLGVHVPVVSLACAAGVLAITQRAPIWAAIFVWELARPPWWLLLVFVAGACAAHGLRTLIEQRNAAARTD
jgi:H+/Cl- antiporter ClcA